MELMDGNCFTALLTAAAADGDEDRADGEARDETLFQDLRVHARPANDVCTAAHRVKH